MLYLQSATVLCNTVYSMYFTDSPHHPSPLCSIVFEIQISPYLQANSFRSCPFGARLAPEEICASKRGDSGCRWVNGGSERVGGCGGERGREGGREGRSVEAPRERKAEGVCSLRSGHLPLAT